MDHDIENLAAIIQSSDDAIIGKTTDGVITSWNRGAFLLYGYEPDEAVGRHISMLIPPDRRGEERDILARVQRRERIPHYETERMRKDGVRVHVSLTISPVEDARGNVVGASVIARDVSRRKREDEKFRALLESAPDAMVIVGTDGRIMLVNRQAEQIFGFERGELLGKPIEVLVPQRFRAGHEHHRVGFFMDPKVRPMGAGLELYGNRRDGSQFPVEISLSPIATDEGLLVAAAVRDVTERKRSEERFRKFLEFAPDAIVMVDADGTIVEINSQTSQLFGYERDELVGERVEVLLPERYRERHPSHRTSYFSTARVRPMGQGLELLGRRRDGSEFPVDISLAPLETEEGVLVSAAIRDVSERQRAEEQARRLEQMRVRRRQALELNDEVVQGLTVAQLAHSLGQYDEAARAIERTLAAAQSIVGHMLAEEKQEDPLADGDLRRDRPALSRERDGA